MPSARRIAIVINLNWTMKHHQEIFAGTQKYAREQGWESEVFPYSPSISALTGRRSFDGIIARATPELAAKAARAAIPLVNVWVSSPVESRVPSVLSDLQMAGRMAAEHLVARGFRRFAYVGYSRVEASRKLDDGFRSTVKSEGLPGYSRLLVSSTYSDSPRAWARFQIDLGKWVRRIQPPLGILTVNDKVARYVMDAALGAGLDIPGDVAIVGIENEEIVCRNPDPSISSVELGYQGVGEKAAHLLGLLMRGEQPKCMAVLHPPVMLVTRESSDGFNVDDEYVAMALRMITDESDKPIKVRDVVARVPLSGRSLERRFREARGTTIKTEISRVRIARAKRMLVDTTLLVKQVAESCGFPNTRRFCELFRRLEGVSPTSYRRKEG